MRKFSIALLVLLYCSPLGNAYVLEGEMWDRPAVYIMMNLNPTRGKLTNFRGFPLSDGTVNWNVPFEYACYDWNQYLDRVKLYPLWGHNYFSGGTFGDGINQTHFGSSIGGSKLDTDTLSLTDNFYIQQVVSGASGNFYTFTEGDIVFNQTIRWNSYRGPLWPTSTDIFRVALHELGHLLGLDHPDGAGQNVDSIMNSHIGNTDNLTADDVAGVRAIYGP
jgi:Matrixin